MRMRPTEGWRWLVRARQRGPMIGMEGAGAGKVEARKMAVEELDDNGRAVGKAPARQSNREVEARMMAKAGGDRPVVAWRSGPTTAVEVWPMRR